MDPKDYPNLHTRRSFFRHAACAAVGTIALKATIRDLRLINSVMAQSGISDYKALVCVFLNGGNDSNNLIIPTIPEEYASYATLRTPVLAIPNATGSPATALSLSPLNSDGHSYGFHPACPGLRTLFNEGKSATVFNVGTLVYPMTRVQFSANSVARPPQLFSHSDQQIQWQTSIPDRPPSSGWGGRVTDIIHGAGVNAGGQISMAVSLAGSNTWQRGDVYQQYSVSTGGAIQLTGNVPQKNALQGILGIPQTNMQGQAYANALNGAINEAVIVNTSIAGNASLFNARTFSPADPELGAGPVDLFPTTITVPNGGTYNSSLTTQLKMVARLIDAGSKSIANGGLGMKRQIFFVQVGGYDTHTGQTTAANATPTPTNVILGAHANLFAELSRALYGFQRAMEQIGLSDKVTAFTMSDFGRTFPCNGQGSDHGWGSHHIVVGGAVNGKKTYGKWPTLTVNGPDDTSTGRWIPTMAVDQYSATLATWFGVDSGNLSAIFPNLSRFAAPPAFMNPA